MKRVLSSPDRVFTQYVRDVLESRGIRCLLKNEYLSGAAGELPVNETQPEVWVLDDGDMALAREVIDTLQTPVDASPWVCPNCGEHLEGQFTTCWRCGTDRR
ncbi:MAG: DUF2007 domain-containing protein [Chromatiaceae bacterium]|jgi:hypothetical protein